MPGVVYPPHIAEKLYLLDESIETLLKDRRKNQDDIFKLLQDVGIMYRQSCELGIFLRNRVEEVKDFTKDVRTADLVIDAMLATASKMSAASMEIVDLFIRINHKFGCF
ncbi:MAG: hypothetical protein Q9168_002357 [Polycauliona sp. 1 TL-2023]